MTFDVTEYMSSLPVNSERLSREIAPRRDEVRILNRLRGILEMARSEKENDNLRIDSYLLAKDVDHLNSSRFNIISSGGNGEILASLVGSGILTDFPNVKDATGYDEPEYKLTFRFLGNKKTNSQEIDVHTEFTRPREMDEESEGHIKPLTTTADFHYSLSTLETRKRQLEDEIAKLRKVYNEAIKKEELKK